MSNVRGYGRRSDDEQSGYSPDAQQRACEAWARAQGHTWCGWWFDDDLSGGRDDRPQFRALIDAARKDPGSIVVVHKFDRLSRDTETLLRVVYRELARVQVVSLSESMDVYNPLGKVMLTMQGAISRFYIDNLAAETRKGLHEKAQQGGWIGLPPFGYRSTHQYGPSGERIRGTHQLVPSDDAPVLREIFELYARGNHSTLTIAQELTQRGLQLLHPRSHQRVPWSSDAVRGILRNAAYIGQVSCGGAVYPGKHEPLIDRALWEQTQTLMARRAHGQTGRAAIRGTPLLLTELARCAGCGELMHAHRSGNTSARNDYYRCRGRRAQGADGCALGMTRADLIEAQILELIRTLSITAPLAQAVVSRVRGRLAHHAPAPSDQSRVREQLRRLRALYLAGDPDLDDGTYQRRRAALEAQLRPSETPGAQLLDLDKAVALLRNMTEVLAVATPHEQRTVVQQLMTAVWIRPGEVVAVQTTPAWSALYDAAASQVGEAISAGLEPSPPTWDALPPRWVAWQVAA